MKVSIGWLGFFLILSFFLYFAWYGKNIYKSFMVSKIPNLPVKEGFDNPSNIQIRTCPVNSKRFINDRGFSMCCKGQIEAGHCDGEQICSLSEAVGNIPTCSTWYAAYLLERGTGLCTEDKPNYYENLDGSSGCTSGSLTPAGDASANPSSQSCIIYGNTIDDTGKANSCLNARYLETSMCFTNNSPAAKKSLIEQSGGSKPALVSCSYGNSASLDETTGTCYTDNSIVRNKKALITEKNVSTGGNASVEGWKETSATWDPTYKLNFCSVVQKIKLSGAGTCQDLMTMPVF